MNSYEEYLEGKVDVMIENNIKIRRSIDYAKQINNKSNKSNMGNINDVNHMASNNNGKS